MKSAGGGAADHVKDHVGRNSVIVDPRKRLRRTPWLFAVVFFALILIASEVGFWLGLGSHLKAHEQTKAQIIAVEESVLGILALLLAFSLVMGVSRFDSRRLLVVEEANAIGTTCWRCRLVPPPEGPELIGLSASTWMREYTISTSACTEIAFRRRENVQHNCKRKCGRVPRPMSNETRDPFLRDYCCSR
jgi:hypothetical protein